MSIRTFTTFAFATLAFCGSTPAWSQAVPDINDAINRSTGIDEALEEQQRTTPRPEKGEDDTIDGEAGVFVLTINEIFFVGGTAGVGWAENPLRTADDVGDSLYANAAFTAGIQTKLAETFDFGLSATASGIEYDKAFAPSSRTINGSTNFGMPVKGTPIYVGASIYGGFSYDSDFKNGTGFYGANMSISAGGAIGPKTFAKTSISGGRALNEIDENNAWNANLDIEVTQVVTPTVTLSAQARISRVWYDDFFEDVTFVKRRDWQYGGNVNASWSPTDWLGISASIGYEKRRSAFFLSQYNGFEAALVATARKRF